MSESNNGLRFDIFERVHLPEEVAAIEELEEIELVPHMQALPLDDQIVLRGHLLLTGSYHSQEERSVTRQLEHWIPVEISLPLGRVERLEDLAVEIDNFDVDLLSTRSLNVTGVLGLKGLQVSVPQAPVWQEDSFTVVHQAPPETPRPYDQNYTNGNGAGPSYPSPDYSWYESYNQRDASAAPSPQPGYAASPSYVPQIEQPDSAPYVPSDNEQEVSYIYRPHEPPPPEEPEPTPFPAVEQTWGDLSPERLQAEAPVEPESPFAPPEPDYSVPQAEDKQELKVAVSSKPPDPAPAYQIGGVGLLSQLGDKGAKREAEHRAAEEAAQAEQAANANAAANPLSSESSGDEVEWTRLFLAKSGSASSFRKFKLCIVQREDTLDAIATRYNVQSRELQLHNRLLEPHVTEGQILYIP